ncbi:hypothetical protein V2G26_006231 [Clonostachys chloroleuca]
MSWRFGLAPPHHKTVPHTRQTITSTREIAQNVEPSALPNIYLGRLALKLDKTRMTVFGYVWRSRPRAMANRQQQQRPSRTGATSFRRAIPRLRVVETRGKRNPPKPGRLEGVGGLES